MPVLATESRGMQRDGVPARADRADDDRQDRRIPADTSARGVSCIVETDDELKERFMLHYAAVFFVIAIVAALFGFTGIAAGAASIAKFLFFLFIVIALATLIMGLMRRGA